MPDSSPQGGAAQGPNRSPIVWTPADGPPRWPGGEPRFPIDARFYLAALRGELAALIDKARTFGKLDADGPMSDSRRRMVSALAVEVWTAARGVRRYHDGLTRTAGPRGPQAVVGPAAAVALDAVVRDLALMARDRSALDFARALTADPAPLADLEAASGLLPAVAFDFDVPSPEPSNGRPRAEPKPKRAGTAEERAMLALTRRMKAGESIAIAKIAKEAGCSRPYLSRPGNCPHFKALLEAFRKQAEAALPHGFKDGETGDIEAWEDER